MLSGGSGSEMCELNNANFPRGNGAVTGWLVACMAMVAIMVLLGGLTRLTGSGLSMVEWNPQVLLPPVDAAAWQAAFAKYQASPQYRLINDGMDLAGFQRIFWLEYLHRLWGRLTGVVVIGPLLLFAIRGTLGRNLLRFLAVIAVLGGVQGGIGWLMVASGLVDQPEVSPYRLALHLVTAFVILGALLWCALDQIEAPAARPGGKMWWALPAVVLTTVTWGALVAGFKAGLIYNTFPLMNGRWLPSDGMAILLVPGAIQFAHRVLAVTTVAALSAVWLAAHRQLPARPRLALSLAVGWSWGQASLGVATLLGQVPMALAAAHQMGALVLFGLVLWVVHSLRRG